MVGVAFLLAFAFAPERGLVAVARRRARQRVEFAKVMLAAHLLHHEGGASEQAESREQHLQEHLRWTPEFARRVVRRAERDDLITREAGRLRLTERGRVAARRAVVD
jgi:manganese/zinc/iron transport system permease protein